MKKFTFELPEQKQIEINGEMFKVMHTDIQILEYAVKIKEAADKLNPNDPKAIVEVINSAIGYIDDILGEGAMKKITKGRPLGLVQSVELMTEISSAVMSDYSDKVKDKYNLEPKNKDYE